ncbi:MAG: flagellar protein [Sphingomonadales bacterium]|nr:MAG: flagellar protein [Sphingomonadales bacterium]
MIRSPAMKRIALLPLAAALAVAAPSSAQPALPPAQDLNQLEQIVVSTLGADVGQPGGPMAPIDRRMRLAACPAGIQMDPPSAGAVTVRCTTAGWRLRVPLMRANGATAYGAGDGGRPAGVANADIRKGDPVQLVAQGTAYSITVDATALEDGRIGSRIRVSSASKGGTLFAEVIDVGRVRLLGFK